MLNVLPDLAVIYNCKEKYIEGTINIETKNDSICILTGTIYFKTKNPETLQEIRLKNSSIPSYTIKKYLDIHKNDSEFFKYDPIERYKEIEKKTEEYNKNR